MRPGQGKRSTRGTVVLKKASFNTEVWHCVLKSSAQAVPQTPEVNVCLKSPFTAIQIWGCSGNPLLRKGRFGLSLRQRKNFFRPPSWEFNTQNAAVKLRWPKFLLPNYRKQRSSSALSRREVPSSRGCLWNPQQHLPPSRCPQASRCRTICCINGIFIPSCRICSTVRGVD